MKTTTKITLTLLPLMLLAGCDSEDEVRDVYHSKEECQADWNDGDLCEQMGDSDAENYRHQPGAIIYPYYIWGPRYYPSDRSVVYRGTTFSPTGSRSMSSPRVSGFSPSARTSGVSAPRSGGFGGRGFSGGS